MVPSDTRQAMELLPSGETYTAPANGYFSLCKLASSNGQYVYMHCNGFGMSSGSYPVTRPCAAIMPVRKGDVVTVVYNANGNTEYFNFIPAC